MITGLSSTRRNLLALAAGVALGVMAIVGLLAHQGTAPLQETKLRLASDAAPGDSRTAWGEVEWPLPADLWSVGKAFRCNQADCGGDIALYLRAKIGFCNCVTGVADDEELERLADIQLFGGTHLAEGPGRPIAVAWMKGRSRSYAIADTSPAGKSALMIAFNDRCDAIVGTAIVDHDRAAEVEQAVLDFLNGEVVLNWARITLGL